MSGDGSTRTGGESVPFSRLSRLIALVAFVTAVFLIVSSSTLSGVLLRIAFVSIGVVAIVTAITGFLISAASSIGE